MYILLNLLNRRSSALELIHRFYKLPRFPAIPMLRGSCSRKSSVAEGSSALDPPNPFLVYLVNVVSPVLWKGMLSFRGDQSCVPVFCSSYSSRLHFMYKDGLVHHVVQFLIRPASPRNIILQSFDDFPSNFLRKSAVCFLIHRHTQSLHPL